MEQAHQSGKRVYTIGHSSHTSEQFVELLRRHGIRRIVDVRSAPYSKYTPQFNKGELENALRAAGVEYDYRGRELGGKPAEDTLHTLGGSPDYEKIASQPEFRRGLRSVIERFADGDTALMCSEGDPMACHREKLLAAALRAEGVDVLHILPDGSIRRQEQGSLF